MQSLTHGGILDPRKKKQLLKNIWGTVGTVESGLYCREYFCSGVKFLGGNGHVIMDGNAEIF